jgi:H+-transporting ATPase
VPAYLGKGYPLETMHEGEEGLEKCRDFSVVNTIPASAIADADPKGLTSSEAAARLQQYGPNTLPEKRRRPVFLFLRKFWAPVPWMLEVTIILELGLRKWLEAIIIAVLLVFNAVLALLEEKKAEDALALLQRRLALRARVRRDGDWREVPAQDLVPGDLIHLRMGDLVPADTLLAEGQVALDQSALTGESLPADAGPGGNAYSGTIVRHGEATGQVTATGTRTFFGRTAELVAGAKTVSHLQQIIFTIVKYLIVFDAALIVMLLIYAPLAHLPFSDVLPFVLILLVASVPVALPATFTLATALGAQELARQGVLVTRLSAIEEAAAMDVLLADKTGTITENRLTVATLSAFAPYSEDEVLRLAALASDGATQDPIDLAILAPAGDRGLLTEADKPRRLVPFDPATKRSEAFLEIANGTLRVVKGAPLAVAALATPVQGLDAKVEELSALGYRVLAVASGPHEPLDLVGLVALHDQPRADSDTVLKRLRELGMRIIMITGDGLATARAVAAEVNLGNRACSVEALHQAEGAAVRECDVVAGVLPEDKFDLVRSFQSQGHVVGMTGDGVNDAPALKQAEVGMAVANATDVAKASASLVLTNPGLTDMPAAVETSRRIYQRMLTYSLNKVMKTLEIAVFLSAGVMLTRSFVITPLLIVLLLFTNDFATMSISTDRVSFSPLPDRWRIKTLMATGMAMAALVLILSFAVFFVGRDVLHLQLGELQTLVFLMLVFTGQGNIYLVRERGHFWKSRPSRWLVASSLGAVVVASTLALTGTLMTRTSPILVAGLLVVVVCYLALMDLAKIRVFRTFGLR